MDNLEEKDIVAPVLDNPQTPESTTDELTKERYKQQIEWSRQEAEKYREIALQAEYDKASKDGSSLLELHEKDPKLADEVAKRFNFTNFQAAKDYLLKAANPDADKGTLTEDQFETMYQKRKQKEEHDRAIKKVDSAFNKLDDWLKEKARAYFDKISEGKQLDVDTALEFAEMATLYVSKDNLKLDAFSKWMDMLWSTSVSNSKKVSEEKWHYVIRDWQVILVSNK